MWKYNTCNNILQGTRWSTYSYIEYGLNVSFQYQIKNSIHVISQKNIWMKFCIQTSVNVWKHKVRFEITFIWKVARIVLETFYQNSFLCVFKMINDFFKKCIKTYNFLSKMYHNNVFSPPTTTKIQLLASIPKLVNT